MLPLAAALDFLRIALAPAITSAGERALKLLQGWLSGLPDALAPRQGLAENSLGEFGVSLQGLVGEARLLAQPVSFEVVTTTHAEGIEDHHVAPLAARRLAEMSRSPSAPWRSGSSSPARPSICARPGWRAGTRRAYELVRGLVPFMDEGDPVPADLEPVTELVRSGALSPSSR